ncbi:hypothetical protein IMSAGC022_01292 [Alistipes sp.]|nr:hypothetical protein IMSAGC022_01292 [Alistipes sp.]
MKFRFFQTLAAVVAAAATIGCSADSDIEVQRPDEGTTLTLRTDGIVGDTRTEFDPAINKIKWSASDNAVFYSNGIGRISAIEIGADNIANFKLSGMRPDGTTRTIQGFYPVEARWGDGHVRTEDNQIKAFALTLKSRQEGRTDAFDPEADILVADNLYDVEVSATEKNIVDVRFGRPVAITEIKYVISNDVLKSSDEKVRSVTVHVDTENSTKYLAGNFYFDPATFSYVDIHGDKLDIDNSDFFANALASSVQVMLGDTPAVNADFTAWVVTAPIVLTPGDVIEFTIRTTAGTVITKRVTMTREVAFRNTQRNQLTVNVDNSVTITYGNATEVPDGYYAIATDNNMMSSDVVSKTLDYAELPSTWVGEGEGRKLSISEDKYIWYIEQNVDGTYTVSSKLNGQFIFCDTKSTCYLKATSTPLKIQPADASGKYNISVQGNAGRVLGYNQSSPRFAFYDDNNDMINDLQIIPVYIDNMPDFKLLKNEITVSAAGEYTEKDVYQLRNAAENNVLVDVDGTVVTSASIANAAVTFTVANADADTNGWIKLDFDGTIYQINVVVASNQGIYTESFESKVGSSNSYTSASWESNGFTWSCVYSSTEISTLSSNGLNIAIGKKGHVQTSGTNGIKSLTFDYKGVSNATTLVVTITNGSGTECYKNTISVRKNTVGSIVVEESDITPACEGDYTIKIANTANANAIQIGAVTWTE